MTSDGNCTKHSRKIFPSKFSTMFIAGALVTLIPVVLILWLETISPGRWLVGVCIPTAFAIHGYWRNSVDFSGAIFGVIVGFTLTLGSYFFLACLIVFFVTGSQVTKVRSKEKRKFEENYQVGGRRNWVQVLCNIGPATVLAGAYALVSGTNEEPIDFQTNYRAAWLAASLIGSLAAGCGDTWSSELGSVMSKTKPFLITNFKRVPRGTNGGVSFVGIWFSFIGGLIIGFSYYVILICLVDRKVLEHAPPQWPIIFVGGLSGLFGSIIDSYIGATFQYSGLHKKTDVIVEHPGEEVVFISGRDILDNHCVNLISNILMATIAPKLANVLCVIP